MCICNIHLGKAELDGLWKFFPSLYIVHYWWQLNEEGYPYKFVKSMKNKYSNIYISICR